VTDKPRRDVRYYAAGEYMAVYAHLLIAVWDHLCDKDTAVGTAAIVEARRRGPSPGVLSTTSGLGLPHGGPVLHVYTRRAKNPDTPEQPPDPIRWLHPYCSEPPREKNDLDPNLDPDLNPKWQRMQLALLCRIAKNLDDFNHTAPANDAQVTKELDDRLTYRLPDGSTTRFTCKLEVKHADFHAALRRVVALRRRASNANYPLATRSLRTLFRLFLLTFAAALLFHLFAHWHPQGPHADGDSALRPWLAVAALTLSGWGLWMFWQRHPHREAERAHDDRALAESLRVQFYWSLAGMGRSVSANYMQRQRSELDWIRGAVRSVSFPYHRWRDWFRQLDHGDQILALRCADHAWVQDQLGYFDKKSREWHDRLHTCHRLGFVLALAGLGVAIVLTVDQFVSGPLDWLTRNGMSVTVIAVGLVLFGYIWGCFRHESSDAKKPKPTGSWWTRTKERCGDSDRPERSSTSHS